MELVEKACEYAIETKSYILEASTKDVPILIFSTVLEYHAHEIHIMTDTESFSDIE